MNKKSWNGIGMMSGTSLDGIDLVYCHFEKKEDRWDYNVLKAKTFPYEASLCQRLADAVQSTALEYAKLNVELGELVARHINEWLDDSDPKPDFIASHGHTIFHQPEIGLTTQIGSGAVIAAQTGITTICDFRTTDVALHGQGAPLVPIGDELLFNQYDACLNLGGFSNISFHENGQRIAFDISPCNMALNHVAHRANLAYDPNGSMAQSGSCISSLLQTLDNLDFYQQSHPKSLAKEWFDATFLPKVLPYLDTHSLQDCMRTLVEHISNQITTSIPFQKGKMLVTGGGAFNTFLIQRLQEKWPGEVIVPDPLTINYKEAIVFAFLGLLRLQSSNNCLKSVTGAISDNCGGAIYLP